MPAIRARRPPAPAPPDLARGGGGRERIAGLALALYLVSGSWSLARVIGVEPIVLWQPRAWAVGLLLLLAFGPRRHDDPGHAGQRARGSSLLLPELAWLGFTLLAITWAPALELATPAAIDLGLLIAVALALHRLTARARVELLASSLRTGLLALLLGLAGVAVLAGVGSGRLAVLGGGPNVFGRNMGLLCVLALERALFSGAKLSPSRAPGPEPRLRLMWPVLACAAAGLVVLSGSRGAMISTFVAGGVLLVFGRARLGRRLVVTLIVLGLSLAFLLFTPLGGRVIHSFAERVLDLLLVDRYVSSRDQIYVIALEGGATQPVIGHGLAGFAARTVWPYAHNIVLDAWFETGALGVALLGLYLGRYRRALARRGIEGAQAWVAASVLILVASQFSGGRYDTRALFVFATLALAMPRPRVDPRISP